VAPSENDDLTVRRVLRNMGGFLGGSLGAKLLSFVVITVAARSVGVTGIGLVFFAEATGAVVFRVTDFGFYQVFMRRAARSQAATAHFRAALLTRIAGTVLCTLLFGAAMALLLPEQSFWLTGFFLSHGLFVLHELGRGVLAGGERFLLNAGLALGARAVGTACSVVGMLQGGGLGAWLAGTLTGELLHLGLVLFFASRELRRAPHPESKSMFSEGLTFWMLDVLRLGSRELQLILVTAWLSFEATGFFGLADRLTHGGLLLTSSLSFAAFPVMARRQDAAIQRAHVFAVGALALASSGAIFVFAQLLGKVLLGTDTAEMVSLIRILAAAVLLQSLAQPMDVWLRANDRESRLLWLAAAEAVIATASLSILVPRAGVDGAAYALVVAGALRFGGTALITLGTLKQRAKAC
jgi:O-antigen/teichoic acid export membrane protein